MHFGKNERFLGLDEPSPWDIQLVFSTLLVCQDCNETISCCGIGGYTPEWRYEPEIGDDTPELLRYFLPGYFSKPLPILIADARWPSSIKHRLNFSFHVFFCDLNASANHVRSCVEELLTLLDIPDRATLHERIQLFRATDSENADRAEALKWIGNLGSHGEQLTKQDLFDSYDILEELLEDIYVGHRRSVREKVREINASRGRRGGAEPASSAALNKKLQQK